MSAAAPDASVPPIGGATRLIVALGDPVAQVRFPEIFNRLCAERGLDVVAVPMRVPASGLEAAMRAFRAIENLIGLSVTIPHKGPAARHLDRLSERARRVGVVNAVRREPDGTLAGDIFDGEGFVAGLRQRGSDPGGMRVALVGAGGAGTAIAFALCEAGVAQLAIRDADGVRAAALAERLGGHWPGRAVAASPDAATLDLAINATPLGLEPDDPLPFDPTMLGAQTLVADIVMKPATTALLATAEAAGRPIHRGHHMFDRQIALYAEFLGLGSW